MKNKNGQLFLFFALALMFLLSGCPTSEERGQVLTMKITEKNDSLLTYDSLLVTVHSKDGNFSQEVFHGVLREPKQVEGMPLDPRVGQEYTVTIVGYKDGKISVSKEVTFLGDTSQSKNLPIKTNGPDTLVVSPNFPEILAPADTDIAEGDSLKVRVSVRNPWTGATTLTLENAIPGARIDTAGYNSGEGLFIWCPNYDQSKTEAYPVIFVYSSTTQKTRKTVYVNVKNVNRPPRVTPLANRSVKENETLTFKVEASDPDGDSLNISASNLPSGAQFTAGTFSWKPQTGQAGNYFIQFKVTDSEIADSLESVITVGNTLPLPGKPVIKGKTPTNNKTPTWTWSTGGGGTGTFRYRLNDDDLSGAKSSKDTSYIPPTGLSEGIHTLFVQEVNEDGIWSLSGRYSIVVDVTVPATPTVSVASSLTNNPKPTWTWESGGGGGSGSFRFKMDNNNLSTGSTATTLNSFMPTNNLQEGSRVLYVQEQDSAGNWSSLGSATIKIDLTPPNPPKVSALQASPTNQPKPTWNWAGSNGGSGIYRFKLNDSELALGANSGAMTNYKPDSILKDGKYTLYVQEKDSAGNWSASGTFSLIVDVTPPTKPILEPIPPSPLNSLQPTWTWKSGGKGAGIFRFKLNDSALIGADSGNQVSFKPASALKEGQNTFFIQERDSAGNWSAISSLSLVLAVREEVGVAGFTPGTARELSLAFAKDGVTPYLAFQDGINENKATVMRFNGSSWETVGKAGFTSGGAFALSLAISKSGIPYVAFVDLTMGEKITVMWFNGGTWTIVGTGGFSEGRSYGPSLAFNNVNVPYVIYRDLANGRKATSMRFNGGFWEKVGDVGFTPGGASFISLAFNSIGVPHVAFCNDSAGDRPTVMRFVGTAWENVGSGPVSNVSASSTTLVFNTLDVPYVSFYDGAGQGKITVKNFTGTQWENVGTSGFSSGSAFTPSLAISDDGVPFVAFADGINGRRARVMRFDGHIWDNVGSASGLSAGEVFFTVLAINKFGIPYVGFLDGTNGDRGTVIKTSFDP